MLVKKKNKGIIKYEISPKRRVIESTAKWTGIGGGGVSESKTEYVWGLGIFSTQGVIFVIQWVFKVILRSFGAVNCFTIG